MEPFQTELDKPLGQARPEQKPAWRRHARRFALAVFALAIVSASTAFFMRDQLFPAAPAIAIEAPAPSADTPVQTAVPERKTSSPKIIQVNPDAPDTSTGVVIIRDPSALSHSPLTAHLPDRELLEDSAYGPLPVRDAVTGRRPFDAYARPWSGARGPRITIVIGGLGISQTGTQRAIEKLPPEITLAFAPLGNSLGRWMEAARRKGHEVMMQIPMEPFDYPNVNPGSNTLLVGDTSGQQIENLHKTLARLSNYTGVVNYMGAHYSADQAAMETMMAELSERGLGYLDDGTSARSLAKETALDNAVPFAASDALIDQVSERSAILAKLDELERTARAQGFAVGTGSALDVTVDAVAMWALEMRRQGVEIVPFSAAALDPGQ